MRSFCGDCYYADFRAWTEKAEVMGRWALLHLSTRDDPIDGPKDAIVQSASELMFKYGIAPAWLALYQVEDLVVQEKDDGDGPFFEVALSTDIDSALKNLEHREPELMTALGDRWNRSASLFKKWLNNTEATHVEMYLTEYNEMFDDVENMRNGIYDYINAFGVPYYSGKRSLLSRKPKVSKEWKELLWPISQFAKEPDGHLTWVIFGSSHQFDFDPP